ncbi:MAG TPA: 50S ribosomal protein L29 [Tepidisphaeraceae bacterium]|nr:50S ribosomal protein L29 [Tepidisphaeraceae bacterium]
MKIKEIRDKETPQLRIDLSERRMHLFSLRSQAVTEKLEDPSQLRKARKDIARILTAIRQRELDQPAQPAAGQAQDK